MKGKSGVASVIVQGIMGLAQVVILIIGGGLIIGSFFGGLQTSPQAAKTSAVQLADTMSHLRGTGTLDDCQTVEVKLLDGWSLKSGINDDGEKVIWAIAPDDCEETYDEETCSNLEVEYSGFEDDSATFACTPAAYALDLDASVCGADLYLNKHGNDVSEDFCVCYDDFAGNPRASIYMPTLGTWTNPNAPHVLIFPAVDLQIGVRQFKVGPKDICQEAVSVTATWFS